MPAAAGENSASPSPAPPSWLVLRSRCALELGWVPEELAVIRTIAATLEVNWPDLDMLALFARCAQDSR
jgi:hypothetical protein